MAEFCDDPSDISDIATRDTARVIGSIAKSLAANSPYLNVIGGGTFPSGVSDTVRSVVQMQAAPGDSLALPTFLCDVDMCGQTGHQDLTDTIEFTTKLESFRGRGPNICVKKGYSAFKGSYSMAEDSLKKLITQYVNADVRAQLYLRSASKFTANHNYDFNSLFTGGSETDLGVKFAPLLPTGPMTFKALHYLARYLKETLFADWYTSAGSMPHFRFIGGSDQIEYYRSEVGVQNVMTALTQGGYKLGETALTAYGFEQSPARFNAFDGAGLPVLLNPVTIVTNASKGTAYAKANPTWLDANYEIGTFIAEGSFERQVPEKYVGEGSFKFAPQLHMGELEWHYLKDNHCNQWGDFGWHKYQITRAYKPLRPQHIIHIAYKRCKTDLGLVECPTEPVQSSYTGADSYTTVGVTCEE
jgi:hypothetical protein